MAAISLAASSSGGGSRTFGVHDQPRYKKGHHISGKSNSQSSGTPRGGRCKPKKAMEVTCIILESNVASIIVESAD